MRDDREIVVKARYQLYRDAFQFVLGAFFMAVMLGYWWK